MTSESGSIDGRPSMAMGEMDGASLGISWLKERPIRNKRGSVRAGYTGRQGSDALVYLLHTTHDDMLS